MSRKSYTIYYQPDVGFVGQSGQGTVWVKSGHFVGKPIVTPSLAHGIGEIVLNAMATEADQILIKEVVRVRRWTKN